MKPPRFRLESVLRHYQVQKQRMEIELHQGVQSLRELEDERLRLNAELTAIAGLLQSGEMSGTRLVACCRASESLAIRLAEVTQRRDRQVEEVRRLQALRNHWAIREESLASLREALDRALRIEEMKNEQLRVDEAVLRRRLDVDPNDTREP